MLRLLTGTGDLTLTDEYAYGIEQLDRARMEGVKIEAALTHDAPSFAAEILLSRYCPYRNSASDHRINSYFEEVSHRTEIKKWYFGHYHKDWQENFAGPEYGRGKDDCLYMRAMYQDFAEIKL